jgi:hypothetical protein
LLQYLHKLVGKCEAGKKIFKNIDVKKIDSDFAALLASSPPRQSPGAEIVEFIRHHYFPVAYLFAAQILSKSGGSSDFKNDSAELAVDAMEDIITGAREGKLSFQGKSFFSSYLYAAILNKHREGSKLYYPAEVKRRGMPAIEAYRLLLIEGYDPMEVGRILEQEYGLDWENAYPFIALAESYRNAEQERSRKRKKHAEDISYDAMIEAGAPVDNPVLTGKTQSAPPEDEFLRREAKTILKKLVERLPEPSRSVITGYFLEKRWDSIKEMEAELGLKNGSYELKKARDMLAKIIK